MIQLSLCTVLLPVVVVKAEEPLPSGEALMEKYLEVTGGRAAYEKVRTSIKRGHIKQPSSGMSIGVTIYAKAPNSLSQVTESELTGKAKLTADGQHAWIESPQLGSAQLLEGEMGEQIVAAAMFNPELHWKKRYASVTCVGVEEIEGTECYKVIRKPIVGNEATTYMDKASGHIIKEVSLAQTRGGKLPVEIHYRDYKKAGDITLPFTQVRKMNNDEQQIVLDDVQFNVEIPADVFAMPESIKSVLADRDKTATPTAKPAGGSSSD